MAKPKGKGSLKTSAVKGKKPAREDPMAFKRASRVNKITNASDAGFEGQDAFGMGDDEISLNTRSNGADDDFDDDLEEDEVLALNLPEGEESDDDAGDDEGLSLDDTQAGPSSTSIRKQRMSNQAKDLLPLEPKTKTSRFEKSAAASSALASANLDDDEAEPSESDSDDADGDNAEEDEYNDEWARTGGYHVSKKEIARLEDQAASASGKPYIDEDDAQREQLELYEARRIQKEAKERLGEEDYLDAEELDADDAADADADASAAISRSERRTGPTGLTFATREEAIAHLVSKEPELLALVDDFSVTSDKLPVVQQTVLDLQKAAKEDNPKVGFAYLYQELTATYLTLLAFYLHIRSHSAYPAAGGSMADTVLARLAKVRQYISTLDDLGIIDLPGEQRRKDLYIANGDDESDDLENLDREALMARIGDLDDDELDALIAERQAMLQEEKGLAPTHGSTKEKKRKSRTTSVDEGDDMPAIEEQGPKRKRKRAGKGTKGSNAPLLNLDLPPVSTKGAALVSAPTGTYDDFVEPTSLSAAEASEKAGKKKSLRFYTSKIDATSARRSGAGKERGGGDDDVPYRSKERAREAALKRQQHLQGQAASNSDLDGNEYDDADFALAQQVNENMREADSYYELVAGSKKAAKEAKKDAYDEAALHDRAAIAGAEPLDPNNPRAVNRLIMANKGLTPKRPKSVRNPRVKKRQRYEQAQKKVASMKPVYKGGLGSAAYQGEKTGISSKVVKSRSL